MHPTVNEILKSTRKRIQPLRNEKKKVITPRNFQDVIKARKQRNLIPVIAEVKPSSPTIFNRNITPQDAADIARQMEASGAAAISVLTEPQFFRGSIENLNCVRRAVGIPVLLKDFFIDKAQIYEAESDLILLIAGILDDKLD
ncbi:MAG: indole-3-glycerol-phosphate synthase, partial [Candidatus Methanoperedens sp.]|nr:indole-3-glycerol-phosphate synthase [Candidatus Methanoperedens sp.]